MNLESECENKDFIFIENINSYPEQYKANAELYCLYLDPKPNARTNLLSDDGAYGNWRDAIKQNAAKYVICFNETSYTESVIKENTTEFIIKYKVELKTINKKDKEKLKQLYFDNQNALEKVKLDGLYLEKVSKFMKRDKAVVTAAVRQNGLALKYADESLLDDNSIVFDALNQNVFALRFVTENKKREALNRFLAAKNRPLNILLLGDFEKNINTKIVFELFGIESFFEEWKSQKKNYWLQKIDVKIKNENRNMCIFNTKVKESQVDQILNGIQTKNNAPEVDEKLIEDPSNTIDVIFYIQTQLHYSRMWNVPTDDTACKTLRDSISKNRTVGYNPCFVVPMESLAEYKREYQEENCLLHFCKEYLLK